MNSTDELLLQADTAQLFGVLQLLADVAAESDEETKGKLINVLTELHKFVEIHNTRTRDLVTFRDKIEVARAEFSKVSHERDRYKNLFEDTQKQLHKLMSDEIDKDLGF